MPSLTHISKLFAVKQAKITPLTADPSGGTATYGTAISVPGIKAVTITGAANVKELHGDHQLLDVDSTLQSLAFTFHHAKSNIDERAAVFGGTATDSGTTPAQIAKWRLLGTDVLFPYYKFEAVAAGVDLGLGDGHIVLWKCKTTNFPTLGFVEDDYQLFDVTGIALPRTSDSQWIDLLFNETAIPIP